MDIQELTQVMHNFVRAKGWYDTDSARPQTASNLAASLAIEAAEVLEHFQWDTETTNKSHLAEELADVALYLLQLASICEIDLEKAMLEKLESNYKRAWNKSEED